jgi:hypothetical protein
MYSMLMACILTCSVLIIEENFTLFLTEKLIL